VVSPKYVPGCDCPERLAADRVRAGRVSDLQVWGHTSDPQPAERHLVSRSLENGGWLYRFCLIGILVGVVSLASNAMPMAGLVWQSGVGFVAAIGLNP